jgi:lipopolysaccharide transport system permease protein
MENIGCGDVIRITPRTGWSALKLREFWKYRELLYFLTWRDIKVRYKQTVLGVLWAILQPVLTMVVFTIFFGKLAKMPSDGVPYPIFIFSGLLPWSLFSSILNNASSSLIGNERLISKVYFPRLIIPLSSIGTAMVDFIFAMMVMAGMMVYYRVDISLTVLLIPIFILFILSCGAGVGLILGALNVAYRDFKYVVPFMVQLWMFATPVVYPLSLIPEKYRMIYALNPMAGLLDSFRSLILNRPLSWDVFGISAGVSIIMLIFGLFYFRRIETQFADVI